MNFSLPTCAVVAFCVLSLTGPSAVSDVRDPTGEWLASLVRGDLSKIRQLKAYVDVNRTLPLAAKQRPLHVAAEYGHREVTVWLLENGADRQALDGEGKRPIDYAISRAESDARYKAVCEALAIKGPADKPSVKVVLKRMAEEARIGGKGPVYLRVNGADPEDAFLKTMPGGPVLPFSKRTPGDARIQEVTIEAEQDGGFRFVIDFHTGQKGLSGGVTEGIAWPQYGYWFLKTTRHIDR